MKKLEVFDKVKIIPTDQIGKIIILVGSPSREAYVDVYPGADNNYEYLTMWDEIEKRVECRALNKYDIEDLEKYNEGL